MFRPPLISSSVFDDVQGDIDHIAEDIRNALQSYVGQKMSPGMVDVIKWTILKKLMTYRDATGNVKDDEFGKLAELFAPVLLGIREDFDPCSILGEISTPTLEEFSKCLRPDSEFPGNLIWVETALRRGDITGWSFTRHDAHSATYSIVPKDPLMYTVLNLTIDAEKPDV